MFITITGFYYFFGYSQVSSPKEFVYPLDDTYIHLAIAKNFALNGIWSINKIGFDSASSSVLYTLLLALCIKILGDNVFYPAIINIIFGVLVVYSCYRYFKDFYGEKQLIWLIFLLLPFTMLYTMVIIGMEHTIHMFLMVLAIYFIHKNTEDNFKGSGFLKLLLLIFFISMIRFESMFFTVSLAFALFFRTSVSKSVWVLITGFLPIVIFGLISVDHGGFLFPNSVMIKGTYPSGNDIFKNLWAIFTKGILHNKSFYKYLFVPLILISIYVYNKYRGKSFEFLKKETIIVTIVLTGIMHSFFSVLEYRYENYLMISFLMILIPIISEFFSKFGSSFIKLNQVPILLPIFLIFVLGIYRVIYIHPYLKYASKNISEQQMEMARFLKKYYQQQKVVANDIGAISYFSNVYLLDVVGLGSTDITKFEYSQTNLSSKIRNQNYRLFVKNYTSKHHYTIAVIYQEWFPDKKVPNSWFPIASWTLNGIDKGTPIKRVVFYALNRNEIIPLKNHLEHFNLKKNVTECFYIQNNK